MRFQLLGTSAVGVAGARGEQGLGHTLTAQLRHDVQHVDGDARRVDEQAAGRVTEDDVAGRLAIEEGDERGDVGTLQRGPERAVLGEPLSHLEARAGLDPVGHPQVDEGGIQGVVHSTNAQTKSAHASSVSYLPRGHPADITTS